VIVHNFDAPTTSEMKGTMEIGATLSGSHRSPERCLAASYLLSIS
jgi:hypothetical protein